MGQTETKDTECFVTVDKVNNFISIFNPFYKGRKDINPKAACEWVKRNLKPIKTRYSSPELTKRMTALFARSRIYDMYGVGREAAVIKMCKKDSMKECFAVKMLVRGKRSDEVTKEEVESVLREIQIQKMAAEEGIAMNICQSQVQVAELTLPPANQKPPFRRFVFLTVMEPFDYTLEEVLKDKMFFNEKNVNLFLLQMLSLIEGKTRLGLIHADLHPNNIGFKEGQLFLSDFGNSYIQEDINLEEQEQDLDIFPAFYEDLYPKYIQLLKQCFQALVKYLFDAKLDPGLFRFLAARLPVTRIETPRDVAALVKIYTNKKKENFF